MEKEFVEVEEIHSEKRASVYWKEVDEVWPLIVRDGSNEDLTVGQEVEVKLVLDWDGDVGDHFILDEG